LELQMSLLQLTLSLLHFLAISSPQVREFIRRFSRKEYSTVDIYGFQRFLMSVPHLTVEAAFDRWMRSAALDLGENIIVPDEGKRLESPLILLTAGGVAGAFSRTATAPLDRIKLLFQAGL